jgi:hypothetical protein
LVEVRIAVLQPVSVANVVVMRLLPAPVGSTSPVIRWGLSTTWHRASGWP